MSKEKDFLFTLTILMLSMAKIFAQQPGGVSGTKFWLISNEENNRFILKDISGNKWSWLNFDQNTDGRNINFHPAIFLTGKAINHELSNMAFNQGTLAGIFYPDNTISNQADFSSMTYNGDRISIKRNRIDTNNVQKYLFDKVPLSSSAIKLENSMRIMVYYSAGQKLYTDIWGEDKSTTISNRFKGYLPELILYNRSLSRSERWHIESYLAIKYGITLDTSYAGGSNRPVWNINDPELQKYHNRVCAIGKDTIATIWQPKSNSTYEEPINRQTSFDRDANGKSDFLNLVPKHDSTSAFRSLTIGFVDKSMQSVPEPSYLFWGDNNEKAELTTTEFDPVNFPGLLTIKRKWLMQNQQNVIAPTKVEVSGILHDKLYNPYDYLKYRYVLILFTGNSTVINKTILFNYFGRTVFRERNGNMNFYNNRTVWDSVSWAKPEGIAKHYFTFGKVPLLRIASINKVKITNEGSTLAIKAVPGRPISSIIKTDTLTTLIRTTGPVNLTVNFTEGVAPYHLVLDKITETGINRIADVTIKKSDVQRDLMEVEDNGENSESREPSDNTSDSTGVVMRGKVGSYNYVIPRLENDAKYIISITDKVSQNTTVPVKIISKRN